MKKIELDVSDKVCMIGYSGSGKTTLMKWLIGHLKFPMLVIDTTSNFTYRKNIRYKGALVPLPELKNKDKKFVKIQSDAELEQLIKKINDNDRLNLWLCVDEIDQYTDVYNLEPETSLYFQQGRNYGHGGMFSVRQVGRLNKQVLSNSHYLFLFRIYNKNDLDYISQIIGMDVKPLVQSLDLHQFAIIDLQSTSILGTYILKDKSLYRVKNHDR